MFSRLVDFVNALLGRSRFEREMSSELRFHMETYTEDLVRSGVPRAEAERRARLEFGGVERVREECRQSRGLRWSDELARNVRFAFRTLRKSPVFAVTAVVTLALCIGANTAIYSVVDTVLLRPLPYPEPERLGSLVVQVRTAKGEGLRSAHDGATWEGIRDEATSVDSVVYNSWRQGVSLVSGDQVEYVFQQRVGAGFFRVLGVSLLRGREFTAREDVPEGAAVAVLSYPLWKRLFGEETEAVGESILLRGEPFTVVGVAPPGFQSTVPADVWTPLRPSRSGEGGGQNYQIAVRLPEETSWPEAQAQIRAAGAGLLQDDRPDVEAYFKIIPLQEEQTRSVRGTLLLLWGAVGAVLLIGCVNIAGLLLARVGERQHEIATRMALGGGRGAVLRQLLTESIVLGLLGGVAGVVLGYAGLRTLEILGADQFGIWQPLAIDGRVLGTTLLTAVSAAVLFGLAPAIQACRVDVRSGLTESASRGVAGGRRHWVRRAMVAGEVALVMVLLVNAGVLIRSYALLQGLEPGFDGTNVLTAEVPLQDARYETTSSVAQLFTESLDRIRELPGVESAAVGLSLPFERGLNLPFDRPGMREEGRKPITTMTYVTPDYFTALRIPLLQGRVLRETDTADAAKVALVNEAFAEWYLDGDEPVGAFLKISNAERQIVGVVGDVQQVNSWGAEGALLRELPAVYVPVAQTSEGFMPLVHTWFQPSWIVRTTGPQQGLIGHIQNAVAAVDPQLPFAGFRTMDEVRGGVLGGQRFRVVLLGTLAGLALVLAAVGLYGLIANTVVERTREMGIRLALGSTASQAVRSVALPGLVLGVAGVVVGGVGAWMSASVIASLVWGVSADDPFTFGTVAVCLMLIVGAASLLPALRVAWLNPAETLRNE
jgi:predicted permease